MKTEKISVQKICMIAFAICINFVGGQIALFLKLPIYLDSIGTVFVAAVLGPFYGMLPNLLSGLLMGMTVDIYSLYYAPVGILLGFVTGLVYRKFQPKKWQKMCIRDRHQSLHVYSSSSRQYNEASCPI